MLINHKFYVLIQLVRAGGVGCVGGDFSQTPGQDIRNMDKNSKISNVTSWTSTLSIWT